MAGLPVGLVQAEARAGHMTHRLTCSLWTTSPEMWVGDIATESFRTQAVDGITAGSRYHGP